MELIGENGVLPFYGGGAFPVQYEVDYKGDNYYVRYRGSWLTIEKNDVDVFEQQLALESALDGDWSATDTRIYLKLISDAILADDFDQLKLPTVFQNYQTDTPPEEAASDRYLEKRRNAWARLKPIAPVWAISLAAFLGGPLGAGHFLYENFVAFNQKKRANWYIWSCVVVIVLGYLGMLLLPTSFTDLFPIYLLPPIFGVAGWAVAIIVQRKTIREYQSFGGKAVKFQSVIGYSLFYAFVTLLYAFLSYLFADEFL